jgi:hypothetical protein
MHSTKCSGKKFASVEKVSRNGKVKIIVEALPS